MYHKVKHTLCVMTVYVNKLTILWLRFFITWTINKQIIIYTTFVYIANAFTLYSVHSAMIKKFKYVNDNADEIIVSY